MQIRSLNNNNFSGSLQLNPYSTFFCSNVNYLDVSFNQLNGPIDFEELGASFTNLYLNNNYFNGTFYINSLFNAQILDLSNNNFTSIQFANYTNSSQSTLYMSTLSQLSIFNNNLSGPLPSNFSQMPSLKYLYFQNNNFAGEFPTQIFYSTSLQILNGDDNQFDTLQLPEVDYGNSNLSQIFLTNNKIDFINYPINGLFTTDYLQTSSLLFLGGNPECNKIESSVKSTICRFNQSTPFLKGMIST